MLKYHIHADINAKCCILYKQHVEFKARLCPTKDCICVVRVQTVVSAPLKRLNQAIMNSVASKACIYHLMYVASSLFINAPITTSYTHRM